MIKLILTDLDETLIHYGLERATDHAIDAIHQAQAAGVHFAAITGRIRKGASAAFADDPACVTTIALSNGQIVIVDGQVAEEVELDRNAMGRVASELMDNPNYVLNVLTRPETTEAVRVVVNRSPEVAAHTYYTDSDTVQALDHLPEGPIVKANIHVIGDFGDMAAMREHLQSLSEKIEFLSPGPQVPMLDIVPAGWSKARGAEILRRHLNVEPEEVAAFGDAENDLPMIELYPNSVAVANASQDVADAAGWHIGASADDAVADAIADIARATSEGRMPDFMSAEANERGLEARSNPLGERKVERLPIFHRRG